MPIVKMKWKMYCARMLEFELDDLAEYVTEVHGSLKQSHKSLYERVRNEMTGKTEDEQSEISSWYAEDDMKLGDKFPRMCSTSTFVAIYSFLEQELMDLCHQLEKRRKYKISVQDLSGQGYIDQALNYLEKICGIEEPKKLAQWSEIRNVQKVRNIIVHRRGVLKKAVGNDDPDKAIRQYVSSKTSITIDDVGTLVLTEQFCLDTVATIRDFLLAVVEKLPDEETFGKRLR